METSKYAATPLVDSVLHPTDFSRASVNAFAHALSVSMSVRTELTILHAGLADSIDKEWSKMPGVREMLERWGYLEKNSPRAAVFKKLAMRVSKVYLRTGNAAGGILDFLGKKSVDLIVLATQGRDGLPAWIRPSIAQRVARRSKTMTLFVPESGRGFVSMEDGHFELKRVLIPFDGSPDPAPALTYAARTAVFSGEDMIDMYLLHAGEMGSVPRPEVIGRPYLNWEFLYRPGDAVEQILNTARELEANLIVMPTQNRDGWFDALRGRVSDKVVRGAPCPVLAVPLDM